MRGHVAAAARARTASDLALNRLAGWYAVALRVGSATICAIVGPLAATGGVSTGWLGSVLLTLACWSAIFTWLVWRGGLRWPLAMADALITGALLTAHQHVVPAGLIAAGTTWVLPLASTSVFILQLALPPAASVPAAAALTVVYFASAHPATGGWILAVQAVITASLMTLVRRAGRNAETAISAGILAGQRLRAEAARRADEREAHRQLHDTVLATLTMVASGGFPGPSPTLSEQASRDLQILAEPGNPGPGDTGQVTGANHLGKRLREVAADAAPLQVRLNLAAVAVPVAVIEPIARSVAEALRNVRRHAGTREAEVTVRGTGDAVLVEVADRGSGFHPGAVPPGRRGIADSITGRMADAGGTAQVVSTPGVGTRVVLRWPR